VVFESLVKLMARMMEERFRVAQHMFQSQRKVGHVTWAACLHVTQLPNIQRCFSGLAGTMGAAAGARDGDEAHAAHAGTSRGAFLQHLKKNSKKRGKVGVQGSDRRHAALAVCRVPKRQITRCMGCHRLVPRLLP
jgi:hypothetical protein